MIIGTVDSAALVTPKTITETRKDGSVVTKKVWESLNPQTPQLPGNVEHQKSKERPPNEYDPVDISSPQPEGSFTYTATVRVYF
jgi:hypothetical protein